MGRIEGFGPIAKVGLTGFFATREHFCLTGDILMSKQRVLVTGGAGFVGSHLCDRLVREGYEVISLDNYFSGTPENHVAGVEYRTGHTKDVEALVPEAVDAIFHLGEYSRVAPSLKEPELVWDLNTRGSLAVFEYWRKRGCKLVYAGSSTRFASARADGVEGRDRAPYNFAKYMNTELVHNYGRWYDLPYGVAYFFNVYGPRERAGQHGGAYGTIVETFRQCKIHGDGICTINGTGEQTRAFTHVFDTVDGLLLILEKGEREEYAISAKEVYSLNHLRDMFGLQAQYKEATASTRSSGAEDTSRIEALGWKQNHQLTDYVALCLKQDKQ